MLTAPGLDEIYRRTTTAANTQNPSVTNDYLIDALHSTVALTDGSGTIQTTYAYEPYGATSVYGTATDNPYQYTGRENDQNGLMYFRNRYLTTVGQFASEDPMGFGAGQNMYGYAGGNPVMGNDPLGLNNWSQDDIEGFGNIQQKLGSCMHFYIYVDEHGMEHTAFINDCNKQPPTPPSTPNKPDCPPTTPGNPPNSNPGAGTPPSSGGPHHHTPGVAEPTPTSECIDDANNHLLKTGPYVLGGEVGAELIGWHLAFNVLSGVTAVELGVYTYRVGNCITGHSVK